MALRAKALGLSVGILWGAIFLIFTPISLLTGYGESWLLTWASIYPGYDITWLGVFVGTIYAFVDGFIGGWVVAWLYNKLS